MSLLDDARRIMNAGPATYGEWECVLCHRNGGDRLVHADDCPWLSLPKIVAALERAEATEGRLTYLDSRLIALAGEYEKWSHGPTD